MTRLGNLIMPAIAADKRKLAGEERIYWTSVVARKVIYGLRTLNHKDYFTSKAIENARRMALEAGVYEYIWIDSLKTALHRVFGNPNHMYETQRQRHHAVVYWNPTAHKVNVFALGLMHEVANPEDNGASAKLETIQFVEPGERIFIPFPYTVGGKHSTITGVAPQLRALPQEHVDENLDIMPTTYVEWCTFQSPIVTSPCCSRAIVWSDNHRRLMCVKCGQRCTGV